jgi:hypothetical protein
MIGSTDHFHIPQNSFSDPRANSQEPGMAAAAAGSGDGEVSAVDAPGARPAARLAGPGDEPMRTRTNCLLALTLACGLATSDRAAAQTGEMSRADVARLGTEIVNGMRYSERHSLTSQYVSRGEGNTYVVMKVAFTSTATSYDNSADVTVTIDPARKQVRLSYNDTMWFPPDNRARELLEGQLTRRWFP